MRAMDMGMFYLDPFAKDLLKNAHQIGSSVSHGLIASAEED